MIIGENARAEDMDVNAIKEKQQTNMRAAGADVLERMAPPTRLSLEAALEFLREDECVEVTPESVRLRKVELDKLKRQKAARQAAAPARAAGCGSARGGSSTAEHRRHRRGSRPRRSPARRSALAAWTAKTPAAASLVDAARVHAEPCSSTIAEIVRLRVRVLGGDRRSVPIAATTPRTTPMAIIVDEPGRASRSACRSSS